eukprot:7016298-Pyramimonas_sp.AAC.3
MSVFKRVLANHSCLRWSEYKGLGTDYSLGVQDLANDHRFPATVIPEIPGARLRVAHLAGSGTQSGTQDASVVGE